MTSLLFSALLLTGQIRWQMVERYYGTERSGACTLSMDAAIEWAAEAGDNFYARPCFADVRDQRTREFYRPRQAYKMQTLGTWIGVEGK